MDCSPPGSSVHGISKARILEWVVISYSRGSSDPGIKRESPSSPALAGRFLTTSPPGKQCQTLFPVSVGYLHIFFEKMSSLKKPSAHLLQNYSNQNSMVLSQKQKRSSMEQNRGPRNSPTHLWPTNLQQQRQEYTTERRQTLQ